VRLCARSPPRPSGGRRIELGTAVVKQPTRNRKRYEPREPSHGCRSARSMARARGSDCGEGPGRIGRVSVGHARRRTKRRRASRVPACRPPGLHGQPPPFPRSWPGRGRKRPRSPQAPRLPPGFEKRSGDAASRRPSRSPETADARHGQRTRARAPAPQPGDPAQGWAALATPHGAKAEARSRSAA